jgi:electron transfer flavoprotein beta subunit
VKIGVCVKVTPDTDARIKIQASGAGIENDGIKWILSPYDAFAVEEAVQIKEANTGEVVLFSVGDSSWQSQLRQSGLAVGGDKAVIVEDAGLAGTDSLGIAKTLAAAIRAEECQIVFCGKQAIDHDNVQVPAMVAELLGWPCVSLVNDFNLDGDTYTATRVVGGGIEEVVTGQLPVVITTERGLNKPRYAKLPAIMKAKRKPIDQKDLASLGLSADDVSPSVIFTDYQPPPARPSGRILEGDAATTTKELVRLLREEAKVI